MLGDEDAGMAGEGLEPGEAAVLICFENTWAAPFVTPCGATAGRCSPSSACPPRRSSTRLKHSKPPRRHPERKGEATCQDYFAASPEPQSSPARRRSVSNNVSRRQQGKWAQQEQQQWEQQQSQMAAQAPAAAPQAEDSMDKLKELGELHQSGVLTDEEFSAAKAKILGV